MFSASLPLSTSPPPSSARLRRPTPISATQAATARPLPRIASSSSLYDVLGVHTSATCHEIKAAYRKLVKAVHPDIRSDGQEEFIKVHAAYATLADPNKRAEYDRSLFRQRRMVAPPYSTAVSGYSRRSWETDQCW